MLFFKFFCFFGELFFKYLSLTDQTVSLGAIDLSADVTGTLPFSSVGTHSIDDHSDVDTSTVAPTDGQALVWDNTASQWEPGPAGAQNLADLGDVTITSATAEQVIKYVNFGGRFLAALWDSILEPFGSIFGAILGSFWGQNCEKRRSKKRWKKTGRKKSCDCLRVSASPRGGAPLKHYNPGAPVGAINTTPQVPWRHGGGYPSPLVACQ